jgi:hypothetical protein
MKAVTGSRFKAAGVGISLIFLLAISPMVLYSAAGSAASPGANACTNDVLQYKMATAPLPMSKQTAIGVAESSSQYNGYTANAAVVTDSRAAEEWTFDRTTCTVTLHGLAVNFDVALSNGTKEIVVIDVNPINSTINTAFIQPWASASLSVGSGTAYSGYGVCSSSSCNQELLGTDTYFDQPEVFQPSGTYMGQTEPNCHETSAVCVAVFWTGLATCDYTGLPWSGCSGTGLAQTGTEGEVTYLAGNVNYVYHPFYEYLGLVGFTTCSNTPSVGDIMEAVVENQYLVLGTTGSNWYTFVADNTANWACDSGATADSYSPIYSEYILERPQNGSSNLASDQHTLPVFGTTTFTEAQLYQSSWNSAYNDYNSGYGFGVQMVNSKGGTNYQNTKTGAMSQQVLGGTDYGEFSVYYNCSIGT